MMMRNKALFVVAVIALLAGGYFLFSQYLVSRLDGTGGVSAPAGSDLEQYDSPALGVSFTYPFARYDIQTPAEGTVVLVPEGYVPPQGGEGPPAITITSVAVDPSTDLESWIRTDKRSNFYLSADQKLAGGPTHELVGGEPGFMYRYSGLYENMAIATKHSSKIYVFNVSWSDSQDLIRKDFTELISSVKFTNAR
jgi:hypothetical protein